MVNNGFAFGFKERNITTTGGMEIEDVKFFGQVPSIMRSSTNKDGHLLSYVNFINDTDANTSMNNIALNDRLIISHSVAVDRGKNGSQLPLENKIGIVKLLGRSLKF